MDVRAIASAIATQAKHNLKYIPPWLGRVVTIGAIALGIIALAWIVADVARNILASFYGDDDEDDDDYSYTVNRTESNPQIQQVANKHLRGIENLGATCYMNSALKLTILAIMHDPSILKSIPSNFGKVLAEYVKALQLSSVKAQDFFKALRENGWDHDSSSQEDASDCLRNGFFKTVTPDPENQLIVDKYKYSTEPGSNPTHTIENLEYMFHSLYAPSGNQHHLDDLIYNDLCTGTSESGPNLQYVTHKLNYILNVPKSLMIPIVREGNTHSDTYRRDFTLETPKILYLPICSKNHEFIGFQEMTRSGAIIHHGSLKGGHYFTIEETPENQFIMHNDSSVEGIPPATALEEIQNNGTVLLYVRSRFIPVQEITPPLSALANKYQSKLA